MHYSLFYLGLRALTLRKVCSLTACASLLQQRTGSPMTHRFCHDTGSGLEQAPTPAGSQAAAWATDPAHTSNGTSFRKNSLRENMLSAIQHAQQQQAHPWLQQVTSGGQAGQQQAEDFQALCKCCLKLVLPTDCSGYWLSIICLFGFPLLAGSWQPEQGAGSCSSWAAATVGQAGGSPAQAQRCGLGGTGERTSRAAQHMWCRLNHVVGADHRCEPLRQDLVVLVASRAGPSRGILR